MGSLLFLQINRSKKSIQVFNRHDLWAKFLVLIYLIDLDNLEVKNMFIWSIEFEKIS